MAKDKKASHTGRMFPDHGIVEDIPELKYPHETDDTGKISGTLNQINTKGATGSLPEEKQDE